MDISRFHIRKEEDTVNSVFNTVPSIMIKKTIVILKIQ